MGHSASLPLEHAVEHHGLLCVIPYLGSVRKKLMLIMFMSITAVPESIPDSGSQKTLQHPNMAARDYSTQT